MWINVIEHNKDLNAIVKTYLEAEGYNVRYFFSGNDVLDYLSSPTDLWIIDIMLPNIDGSTLFSKIKEIDPKAIIIFISVKNQDKNKIIGLEVGCNEYISKSFIIMDLIIKINRFLNDTYYKDKNLIVIGNYNIHQSKQKVYLNSEELDLSVNEYDLLIYFIHNMRISLSREEILMSIWGIDYLGSSRMVDDTVRKLRRKMPQLAINTVYGYGYIFEGLLNS